MSRATTPRMRRINELLRAVVAEEVTELKDPRLGFVTVTEVDTAPDLRNATVFYSVLGDDDEADSTAVALASAAKRIQAEIATQVRLKYTPKLRFEVDYSIQEGLKIDQILRDLEHEADSG